MTAWRANLVENADGFISVTEIDTLGNFLSKRVSETALEIPPDFNWLLYT